ncbi:MAG: hypothetical protein IT314_02905 [Anaerolineales bacterium]|nr:hypothetical protein [Anaerolineales bacterium]
MKEFLLSLDTMWIVALIVGLFIFSQLRSGEIYVRWFGPFKRTKSPIVYWLFIVFYVAVFGIVVFAWMSGVRIPVSEFFD